MAAYEAVRNRLLSIPGVRQVSYGRGMQPLMGPRVKVALPGSEESLRASLNYVGPGYLETLGITRFTGRDIANGERRRPTVAAIISKALADVLWPHQSPIGRTLRINAPEQLLEVIGTAGGLLERQNGEFGQLHSRCGGAGVVAHSGFDT